MKPLNQSIERGFWRASRIIQHGNGKRVFLHPNSGFTYLPLHDSSLEVLEILTAYSSVYLSFSFCNVHYETVTLVCSGWVDSPYLRAGQRFKLEMKKKIEQGSLKECV